MLLERVFVPNRDTYISSIRPRQNFRFSSELRVTEAITAQEISLLQFLEIQNLPVNSVIEQTLLECYVLNSIPASADLSIHPILSYWKSGTATWNNPPIIDSVSKATFSGILLPQSTLTIDITDLAQEWLMGSLRNRGLAILATDTLSLRLASVNQKNIRLWPQLTIKFKLKGEEISIVPEVIVRTDEEEYVADTTWRHTRIQDVSKSALTTYLITNLGGDMAEVYLSVSPDELVWLPDSRTYEILPGESLKVFPTTYLSYIRMSYRSDTTTSLKFFFQMQQAT